MFFGPHRYAVGTFANRLDVQQALHELRQAGLKTTQISIVSNDIDAQEPLDEAGMSSNCNWENEASQDVRTTAATVTGSLLGAIGGCLVGLGLVSLPGINLIVAVGTSMTALMTTLAGAGIGAASGGLIEALGRLAIPSDSVDLECYSSGEYLVMVNGTDDEVERAESILGQSYFIDDRPLLS